MKPHLQYLSYVVRHKWFVYRAGRRLGLGRWQLLIHDWHKFLPSEWEPYVDYFYGPGAKRSRKGTSYYDAADTGDAAFDVAWLKHQHRAPHHWQHWVLTKDDGSSRLLPMPDRYRREMLADWRGAGAALGKPDTLGWYRENRSRMQLHGDTREWVERALGFAHEDLW